jgi:Cys-tRNA(Pro)/Cys-tRNA(Cys) deacylase
MTPAIRLLDQAGVAYQLHTYQHDAPCTDFGLEASQKLSVEPQRMFKTLVVRSDTGSLAMVLVSVQDRVDLKKLAHALGSKKADLADPTLAEKTTGYVVGGISALGGRKVLPIFVDQSMESFSTIYISAGKRGLQLELAPRDLIQLTKAMVVSLV